MFNGKRGKRLTVVVVALRYGVNKTRESPNTVTVNLPDDEVRIRRIHCIALLL